MATEPRTEQLAAYGAAAQEEQKAADVFDHLDVEGTGRIEVCVIEELLNELFNGPVRAADFVETLYHVADDSESPNPTITRQQFITLTANDALFASNDRDTVSDISDLFSILCTQLRVTALPISQAATLCRHIDECSDDVLEQVIARMQAHTNGKVITETDVAAMVRDGVFHPILYPDVDTDLAPDTLRRRASVSSATPTGRDGSFSGPGGSPLARQESDSPAPRKRRNSNVRRNGWKRFGSVVAGAKRRASMSERGSGQATPVPMQSVSERGTPTFMDSSHSSRQLSPTTEAESRSQHLTIAPRGAARPSIASQSARSSMYGVSDAGSGSVFDSYTADPVVQIDLSEIDVDSATDRKKYYLRQLFQQVVGRHSRMHYRHFKALVADDLFKQQLPTNPSESLQNRVFEHLDSNGDGFMEFPEFVEAFGSVISDDGQFVGFERSNFSDGCLLAVIGEVEQLAYHETEVIRNHELEIRHERLLVKEERKHVAQVDSENEQLEDEIERLRVQLAQQARSNGGGRDSAVQPDPKLEERVRELTRANASLADRNAELTDTTLRLSHRNDRLQEQVDSLEAERAENAISLSQLGGLNSRVLAYDDRIKHLESVIEANDKTVRELEDEAMTFDGVVTDLQTRLSTQEAVTEQAQRALAAEQKETSELRTALIKLEERDGEWAVQVQELEATVEELRDELLAQAPTPTSGDEVARLTKVATGLRIQVAAAKTATHAAQDDGTKQRGLAEKNEQAYRNAMVRLTEALSTIKDMEMKLNEATRLRRSVTLGQNKQLGLEKQITKLESDLEHFRELLSAAENEVTSNIRSNLALTRRTHALESERAVLARALNLKADEVKRLNKAARVTAADKLKMEVRVTEETDAAAAAKAKLREALQLVVATSSQLDELRTQVTDKSMILNEHFGNLSQLTATPAGSPPRNYATDINHQVPGNGFEGSSDRSSGRKQSNESLWYDQ
eukprot:m.236434 g.236434  ORF g.236434 m.236434 type:complete len:967 (-) comp26183_c1_seq12:3306-6206(-)